MQEQTTQTIPVDADMARLDALAKLMDSQFRIPGTQMRFGLDGLLGLIPYVGDLTGFVVSMILMATMVRRGAGVGIMLRMMSNFVLDALIGSIPLLGDLFDFGYKANRRNVQLLKAYYASGKKRPSAAWSMVMLAFMFVGFMMLLIWATWKLAALIAAWIFNMF